MKKTLLATTLLLALSATTLTADAFCWRNLNPANWGTCPKCEKTASCKCKKQKLFLSCIISIPVFQKTYEQNYQ